MQLSTLQSEYDQNRKRFVTELSEFLRFKSISADPAFNDTCRSCANWLISHLKTLGFETSILETKRKPVVYGERKGGGNCPTILFYGHYDVQPPDPLELWESDPFEPVIKEERLYARGAQDNKGQLFYVLKAIETLIKANESLPTIKILIEGEEECGSVGILESLESFRSKIQSNVLLVCDTGTLVPEYGCITMGLRGISHMEIKITGPLRDLHSGVHGGIARNPAIELSKILASLHDESGKVVVDGFYDGMIAVPDEDKALANAFPIPKEMYVAMTGIEPDGGEKGLSIAERRGFRPTIEINGITSGYQGAGSKTIIPSWASAKLSIRLCSGQDPEKTATRVIEHLQKRTPASLKFEVVDKFPGGGALLLSSKSKPIALAKQVLEEVTGKPPIFMWEGASIPLIKRLSEVSGATPVLVGFGLDEDNIHAPNESFSMEQFRKGFLFAGRFLTDVRN